MIGLKTTQTAAAFMLTILLFAGMVGLAAAWSIDIDAEFEDASVLISSSASTDNYIMLQTAEVDDGTGYIGQYGEGTECEGYVIQGVDAEGSLVSASMAVGSIFCVPTGEEGCPCPTCRTVDYSAYQLVEVENGDASICQAQGYAVSPCYGICTADGRGSPYVGQFQYAEGSGESVLIVQAASSTSEDESHVMGAFGENVSFWTVGVQYADMDDASMSGWQLTEFCYGTECWY